MFRRSKNAVKPEKIEDSERRMACADDRLKCAVDMLAGAVEKLPAPPQKNGGLPAFRGASLRTA